MKKFWMVIGEHDEGTRDRCELLEVARTMANERAKQAPGRKFYILEVIESRMMTVPEIMVYFPQSKIFEAKNRLERREGVTYQTTNGEDPCPKSR